MSFDKILYFPSSERAIQLHEYLSKTSFFEDPASTKFHLCYVGGLAEHTVNMTANLQLLTDRMNIKWMYDDSPIIVGMCHDLCKVGAYVRMLDGSYRHNSKHPEGHGKLSIEVARRIIDLSWEEEYCIAYHMGNWTKEIDMMEDKSYTEAIEDHPNILFTHTADMMATFIDEVF